MLADAAGFLRGQFLLPGVPEVIIASELKSFQRHISGLELPIFCWKAKKGYRNAKCRQKGWSPSGATLYQETSSGLQETWQTVAV